MYAEQELAAAKGREQALQDQLMKEVDDSHERLKKQFVQYGELEVRMLVPQFPYSSYFFSLIRINQHSQKVPSSSIFLLNFLVV